MGYKGNNGEYGVGYIAPSPPLSDGTYFPGGPISPGKLVQCLKHWDKEVQCSSCAEEGSNYCTAHNPYNRKKNMTESKFVPDPKAHLIVSLIKSGVRIIGYLLLLGISSPWAKAAAVVLVVSEVIGIVEELV